MTIISPLWMQQNEYPAELDRLLIPNAFGYDARVLWGLEVTPGPGDQQVTIAPGQAIVGDANERVAQMVLVTNDAPLVVEQFTQPSTAHVLVLTFFFEFVGFDNVNVGDPETPGMVPLVEVAAAPAVTPITAGMLTDRRVVSPPNKTVVGTIPPPSWMLPGSVYLRVS